MFHYSFHARDLDEARRFYRGVLGCAEGRSAESWVDFRFFGHQLSVHRGEPAKPSGTGSVDGIQVPMPHFGAVLSWDEFHALARRVESAGVRFVVTPRVRYPGQIGEQATMFFLDPSGNALEFKAFRRPEEVFAV